MNMVGCTDKEEKGEELTDHHIVEDGRNQICLSFKNELLFVSAGYVPPVDNANTYK
jgi:hypothetical protein